MRFVEATIFELMRMMYSEAYPVCRGKKIYQLQALDMPEETLFLVKRSGELISTITINEKGEWQSDKPICTDELNEIVKWIEELFM